MIKILNKYKNDLIKVGVILSYENIDDFCFDIYYKDINIGRVNPNRYYYHSTQDNNLDGILKNGLLPKTNYKNHLSYPPTVFVSDDEHIFYFGGNVLLRITTEKTNNKWYMNRVDICHLKKYYQNQ